MAPFQMAGLGTWIGEVRTGPARRTQGEWASRSRLGSAVDAVDALRSGQFHLLIVCLFIFLYKNKIVSKIFWKEK